MAQIKPETWLRVMPQGLYCAPGDFYIDPHRPVSRAVITHGHGDHARPGNAAVLTTPGTAAIMGARLGDEAAGTIEALNYGAERRIGDVTLRLVPAGHVLGSAQIVLEYAGSRVDRKSTRLNYSH